MTAPEQTPGVIEKPVLRRRILTAIGATGVLVSAGVFGGKPKAASAAPASPNGPNCCNLAHYPANTTYDYCHAHAAYIWYCSEPGGFLHCSCCETSGDQYSAADCHYN
ncbi:hypothetical protein [Fodinicola feengrottensis]|uniref:Twin-arginine translocation signal domain-containing protein n=1 Tax=Fodinicola feengrottensis TaxID=435914 RepID=A0ABN2ISQ5_9ACTN|nr:hypothetical protein [Fodinicola feengrottensis]